MHQTVGKCGGALLVFLETHTIVLALLVFLEMHTIVLALLVFLEMHTILLEVHTRP